MFPTRRPTIKAFVIVMSLAMLVALGMFAYGATKPLPEGMTTNLHGIPFMIMGGLLFLVLLISFPFGLAQVKRQQEYFDLLEEMRQKKRKP